MNSIIIYRMFMIKTFFIDKVNDIRNGKPIIFIEELFKKSKILFVIEKFLEKKSDKLYVYEKNIKLEDRFIVLRKLIEKSFILRLLSESSINFITLIALVTFFPFLPSIILILLGAMFIFTTTLNTLLKNNLELKNKQYVMSVLFFIFIVTISAMFNLVLKDSLLKFSAHIVFILSGLLVPLSIKNRKQLEGILKGITLGLLMTSLFGFYQKITGVVANPEWLDEKYGENLVRVFSTFENPNVFGEYLVMTLPLVFIYFDLNKNLLKKLVIFSILGLGALNLQLTLSRGAILSFGAVMVLLIVTRLRKYIPFLLIGLLFLPKIISKDVINRVLSSFVVKSNDGVAVDSSISYRKYIYTKSFELFKQRPITGFGIGQFNNVYLNYAQSKSFHAHNLYLMMLVEGGIMMLLSYLYMSFTWVKNIILRYFRNRKSEFITISWGIALGILGVLVQGVTDYIWHNYKIVFYYFFLMGLSYTVSNFEGEKLYGKN